MKFNLGNNYLIIIFVEANCSKIAGNLANKKPTIEQFAVSDKQVNGCNLQFTVEIVQGGVAKSLAKRRWWSLASTIEAECFCSTKNRVFSAVLVSFQCLQLFFID